MPLYPSLQTNKFGLHSTIAISKADAKTLAFPHSSWPCISLKAIIKKEVKEAKEQLDIISSSIFSTR